MVDANPGGRDRSAQKRRTRRAILMVALEMMQRGETPSVNAVAEAAEVSRRTVYLYFPTLEQLLTEAALEAVRTQVEAALDLAESVDVEARLDTLVGAALESSIMGEVALRTLVRITVERRLDEAKGGPKLDAPLRGGRRIEWIKSALGPVRERLGGERFERLVSALAMIIGLESLLVLRDIRGLNQGEMEEVSRWAARVLLRASLEESEEEPKI
jgi:AcrR family transcriptional regulator